jgi:hypothetical protein
MQIFRIRDISLALLLLARAAAAQDTGIAADRLQPAVGPTAFVGVEGADLPRPSGVAAALSIGAVDRPIALVNRETGATVSVPVASLGVLDGAAEVGLGRIALGLGAPVTLWARGDRLAQLGVGDERPLGGTGQLGDVRLRAKAALGSAGRLRVALVGVFTVPGGGARDFAATSGPTFEPRLVAQLGVRFLVAAVNLGVRFAPERALFATRFGDELDFGVAAMAGLHRLRAIVELAGAVGDGARPVELRGALRWNAPRGFSLDAVGGAGLTADATAPRWRVAGVVRWSN